MRQPRRECEEVLPIRARRRWPNRAGSVLLYSAGDPTSGLCWLSRGQVWGQCLPPCNPVVRSLYRIDIKNAEIYTIYTLNRAKNTRPRARWRLPRGKTAKSISVELLDDAKDEGEETFTLVLKKSTGAVIADGEAAAAFGAVATAPGEAWDRDRWMRGGGPGEGAGWTSRTMTERELLLDSARQARLALCRCSQGEPGCSGGRAFPPTHSRFAVLRLPICGPLTSNRQSS